MSVPFTSASPNPASGFGPPDCAGAVVALWNSNGLPADGHEAATLESVAREVASLGGRTYRGLVASGDEATNADLVVPRDALAWEQADRWSLTPPGKVFGGIVPFEFVAGKAITHPLIGMTAERPEGWSSRFPEAVASDVLAGYAAFARADAREGAIRLLASGPVRMKPAAGVGGRGQEVVRTQSDIDRALDTFDPDKVRRCGIVIEQDLSNPITFSVGQVALWDACVSYVGTQVSTRDHGGRLVYGGSTLAVVEGGWDALIDRVEGDALSMAIRQAMNFDTAAMREYGNLRLSRRNYDVIAGRDAVGRRRSGVLEQSWRIGGATPAELLAIRAFARGSKCAIVRAQTVEVYGDHERPADAVVFYEGVDPRVGRLTKYSRVEGHGNVLLSVANLGR